MRDAGPADVAGGEDAVLVALLRFHHAIGRHEDRAGELGELVLLVLPCAAVISGKVFEFLQFRITLLLFLKFLAELCLLFLYHSKNLTLKILFLILLTSSLFLLCQRRSIK